MLDEPLPLKMAYPMNDSQPVLPKTTARTERTPTTMTQGNLSHRSRQTVKQSSADQRLNLFAADRAAVRVLGVVVLAFPVMMAVSGAKEPPIAVQAAIRILKQHMVKEPILE